MLSWFKRKPSNPGRELAMLGVAKRKASPMFDIRAANEMRARWGWPLIERK